MLSSSSTDIKQDELALLALNKALFDAINEKDWNKYEQLCDPAMTCFEPEAEGHLVEGMDFHKFYFDLFSAKAEQQQVNVTLVHPQVGCVGFDWIGLHLIVLRWARLGCSFDLSHSSACLCL